MCICTIFPWIVTRAWDYNFSTSPDHRATIWAVFLFEHGKLFFTSNRHDLSQYKWRNKRTGTMHDFHESHLHLLLYSGILEKLRMCITGIQDTIHSLPFLFYSLRFQVLSLVNCIITPATKIIALNSFNEWFLPCVEIASYTCRCSLRCSSALRSWNGACRCLVASLFGKFPNNNYVYVAI